MCIFKSLLSAVSKHNMFAFNNNLTRNGYIKINIEGSIPEGITFNESYVFDKYYKNHYYSSNLFQFYNDQPNKTSFMIDRFLDKNKTRSMNMRFTLDGEIISLFYGEINILKKINKNEEVNASFYFGPDNNPFINVKFNRKTHEISGEFRSLVEGSSIINVFGDFKLKLTEMHYHFNLPSSDLE